MNALQCDRACYGAEIIKPMPSADLECLLQCDRACYGAEMTAAQSVESASQGLQCDRACYGAEIHPPAITQVPR